MKTMLRFVRDESGIVLPLAMSIIVLIGVMGAGLLIFVTRDLNAVVEVNQGQRAFEVADAGVQVAKRQLASSVVRTDYDGGVDDIQWSAAMGGLTLNDLSNSTDSVNVKIEYVPETVSFPEHFLVISTGTYGNAKRKIEAIFKGVVVGTGGGDGLGHPLYYTPSDIKIKNPVNISGISMFSEGDILVEGDTTRQLFINDMAANNSGTLRSSSAPDELSNWYTPDFQNAPGTWNTQRRMQNGTLYGTHNSTRDLRQVGLGAEGIICGFAPSSSIGTCDSTTPSVADGVYGYDCTTGPVDVSDAVCPQSPEPRGNALTFVDKQPQDKNPNDANTITFPFPRPTPIPERLKEQSEQSAGCSATRIPQFSGCYYRGIPNLTVWQQLFPNASDSDRVVFIDAGDAGDSSAEIDFNLNSTNEFKGVLVVWCGSLVQRQDFRGIILNLYGDGSSFGASSCGPDKGIYRNAGRKTGDNEITQSGWVYAQGGTASRAGIELDPNSRVQFSRRSWSFLNDAFEGPPPTSFALDSWRELYQ